MMRAERAGRLVHMHSWRLVRRSFEPYARYRCETCPKVVTEMQMAAAPSVVDLFLPMRAEQLEEFFSRRWPLR